MGAIRDTPFSAPPGNMTIMSRAHVGAVIVFMGAAFVQCVGDDPDSTTIVPDGGSSESGDGGSTNPGTDGSSGETDSDAGCATGLATCGGGGACATKLDEDPLHCGACGHACMGGDCVDGQCQPELLASGFPLPVQANLGNGLAIDDKNLYFATDTRVYKLAKTPSQDAGAAAVMLNDAPFDKPRYLAIKNGRLWWTSMGPAANSGNLWSMSRDDAPNTATAVVANLHNPAGVALDGTYVYWATDSTTQNKGVIRRRQLLGATSNDDLIPNQSGPRHLLVAANRLYWDSGGSSNVFYTANAAINASPNIVVSLGTDSIAGITATSTKLYWLTYDNAVWRAALDGTNAEKLHGGTSAGSAIAVDDNGIYASFQGLYPNQFKDGEVIQLTAPAGQQATSKTIAKLPFVSGLAIDADFVYAVGGEYPDTSKTSGKVWRIRR